MSLELNNNPGCLVSIWELNNEFTQARVWILELNKHIYIKLNTLANDHGTLST
jgi:hypothetical protein